VLGLKTRVGLLGVLAMLLIGSFAAASAEAQGPFWYHRPLNGQGKGVKLTGQQGGPAFQEVAGGGGEQKLKTKVMGAGVTIVADQLQVKGIVYNNALQGQAKLLLTYVNPHVTEPSGLSSCVVTLGTNNTVPVVAHRAWTWDGSAKQLEEQPQQNQKPDLIFLHSELEQGATSLPKEQFTTITFKGTCGILIGLTFKVEGSVSAGTTPGNVGEYSQSQTKKIFEGKHEQHFFNGTKNVGATAALTVLGEPAGIEGSATVKVLPLQGKQEEQELAEYEN
jgi:hypothetical protein